MSVSRNLDYGKIAPEIPKLIAQANRYLQATDLEIGLQHLVLLRVSQMNGCAYCVDLHAHEALGDGEDFQRIACLSVWRECDFYTEAEKAAFGWAEALTRLGDEHMLDQSFHAASRHYSDKQLSDLSFLIATMNAWNRMGIGLGRGPASRN